jgi:hypothetical protein
VFLALERDLLGEHAKKSTPGIEAEDNVSELPVNFSVPNSEQYCLRLKKIIDSAKQSFKPIIGRLNEFTGGFKPKVELPNMEWCWLNSLMPGKQATLYYDCEVFVKEKSRNVADAKFSAYIAVTADCLGKDWLRSDSTRSKPEKRTYLRREPDDPSVEFKSYEKEEGADMVIYVNQP